MLYTIADVINDMIVREDAIDAITAKVIAAASDKTSDPDRFVTIAEGMIHDAIDEIVTDYSDDIFESDNMDAMLRAERAYDLLWDPTADRIWKEARSRASEAAA